MPFGNKAGYVRCYEYGCGRPVGNEPLARQAMRERVQLWNSLVELSRSHGEEREAAKQAEDRKAALSALDKHEVAEARVICHGTPLWWCNYEDVLLAWQNAKRRRGELRFHSAFREPGKLTVRYQTGLAVVDAFGEDTRLQIRPATEIECTTQRWDPKRRGIKPDVWLLRLRIGSDGRAPVWLDLPVVLHRPLPPDGLIRQCSVLRDPQGHGSHWKAIFVVEMPKPDAAPKGHGTVALDIGWRKLDDRLRVCAWRDDEGRHGELLLPVDPDPSAAGWIEQYDMVENLTSIRRNNLNIMLVLLRGFLKPTAELPEWLREQTKTIGLWKAPRRLWFLARDWREKRFAGDDEMFTALWAWREREQHLYRYEVDRRERLLRWRLNEYRKFAAWLARTYSEVIIERFDLNDVARKDGDPERIPAARHQRVLAATSTLRLAVRNACEREGVTVTEKPAEYTTLRCAACGAVTQFDKVRVLSPVCPACGVKQDQDDRAATNLLSQEQGVLVQT